jgi:L-malate glycosyltransferase
MRSPKLLYVIDEIRTTAAGTERQILEMVPIIRDLGLSPHLCTLRASDLISRELAGCPVFKWNLPKLKGSAALGEMQRIVRWLRREQFDIVQSFFPDANLVVPILARFAGVKAVITTRRNQNYWITKPYLRLQRFSNQFSSCVLANSRKVKEAVVATEKLPPDKVEVVYNSIDVERYRPCAQLRCSARQELGMDEHQLLVGIVANLRPVKRIDLFVRAASRIAATAEHARFVVLGEGTLRHELEELCRQLALKDRLSFIGSRPDPVPYLNAFDIAVLCSDSEGLSNSLLEYLACGLPCVVTDVGGNREAVGPTGMVVEPGDELQLADAILGFAKDSSLRRSHGLAAREHVGQTFSIDAAKCKLDRLYNRLLDEA